MNIKKLNEELNALLTINERNYMWSFSTGDIYNKARDYIRNILQDISRKVDYMDLKEVGQFIVEKLNLINPICNEASSISRLIREANDAADKNPEKFEEIDAFYTKTIQQYLDKIEELIEE